MQVGLHAKPRRNHWYNCDSESCWNKRHIVPYHTQKKREKVSYKI